MLLQQTGPIPRTLSKTRRCHLTSLAQQQDLGTSQCFVHFLQASVLPVLLADPAFVHTLLLDWTEDDCDCETRTASSVSALQKCGSSEVHSISVIRAKRTTQMHQERTHTPQTVQVTHKWFAQAHCLWCGTLVQLVAARAMHACFYHQHVGSASDRYLI